MRHYPVAAPWIDAEPITGVEVIAGIEDRRRDLLPGGEPVATGLVAVGDAWASTNPSLGRGASFGAMHAQVLRDVLAKQGAADADTLVRAFAAETAVVVAPYVDATLSYDRHRLAEIDAEIAGEPYETADPAWPVTTALWAGAPQDPLLARVLATIASVHATAAELFADRELVGQVMAYRGGPRRVGGASRAELLAAISTAA